MMGLFNKVGVVLFAALCITSCSQAQECLTPATSAVEVTGTIKAYMTDPGLNHTIVVVVPDSDQAKPLTLEFNRLEPVFSFNINKRIGFSYKAVTADQGGGSGCVSGRQVFMLDYEKITLDPPKNTP